MARVDEEREHQRHGRIDGGELDRLAFASRRLLVFARLHDRRMQIKIMRHHRRAEDADGDVEHLLVRDDSRTRDEPDEHRRRCWVARKSTRPRNSAPMVRMSVMTSASM